MNALETVAAQRDEANMKLRKAIAERDEALAKLARLEATQATAPATVSLTVPSTPMVPSVTPQQSKRPRIFGGPKS